MVGMFYAFVDIALVKLFLGMVVGMGVTDMTVLHTLLDIPHHCLRYL